MIPSTFDTIHIISTSLRIDFFFLIEDILKGDKFFSISDTVTVVGVLGGPANPRPHFEIGKSYLIPVRSGLSSVVSNNETNFNPLLDHYSRRIMGKPPKIFPIESEIITNCEYFGIKDTSWTDFKKYFKETYLIFE